MVRIGFIVEGDTEKILIDSKSFRAWAKTQGIEICTPVIDAKGGGNLLPQNIEPMLNQLRRQSPDHIVILTDLEDAPNQEAVRQRIKSTNITLVFIAVKAIEAWFLADSFALQKWLGLDQVYEPKPEETPGMPWLRIKALAAELNKRGPGSTKNAFAKRMVDSYGFSIANAAQHPECPSAKSFYDGLVGLGQS